MENTSRLKEMLSGVSRNMKTQEQKVAVVLLENEDRIQSLSVADIAREAGVSKATVVRFCKSLGFQGLKDFRVWYEAGKGYQYTFLEPLSRESSLDDILRMIKAGTAKCVGKTLDESLLETLCKILQDMKNASSIAVVGEGDNAPFAQMFGEAIHLVFPNKTSILTTKEKIENTASASLCLIISLSGSDKKTMNYLSSVILDGGKADVFTAEEESLIARASSSLVLLRNERILEGDAYLLAKSSLLSVFSCFRVLLERV